MEKGAKTIIYLICIDNGIIVCNEKNEQCILPAIVFDKKINKSELKKEIIERTHLKVERNNLSYLRFVVEKDWYFYSLVIDLNKSGNEKVLQSPAFANAKGLKFVGVMIANWDPGSKMAINSLKYNPNFKDSFIFINCENKFSYYSPKSKRIIHEVFDKISNIWQSDRPDVIIETLNGITGVECFQVDASGKTKQGSVVNVEKKKMESELYNGKIGDTTTVTRHFSNSLSNLWIDFIGRYNDHLKINEYKKHLSSIDNMKRKTIGFYVEDSTMFGTYFCNYGRDMTPLYLFNIKEFWDLFLPNKSILFMIFQQSDSDHKDMFFITKHDYEVLKEKNLIFELSEIDAQFFNDPHLIGTSFLIPFK